MDRRRSTAVEMSLAGTMYEVCTSVWKLSLNLLPKGMTILARKPWDSHRWKQQLQN